MKRTLLLAICALIVSSVARADHIGFYSDGTGAICKLDQGFSTTGTLIHKFTIGATGSRFKIMLPAGSIFFAFATSFPSTGDIFTDYELAYGTCLNGSIVLGTLVADLTPGIAAVIPPYDWPHLDAVDCSSHYVGATGGSAVVGPGDSLCQALRVEASTWGAVKALYR